MMDLRLIKKRQRWVLEHPCRTVQECGKLGYRADFDLAGGNRVATVLTIDLFSEPLAWHSDVAIIGNDGAAKPVALWSVSDRAAAFDLSFQMLAGVGKPDAQTVDCDGWKVGFVRPLTGAETVRAMEVAGRRPAAEPVAIGEISEFDFSDFETEADEGLFLPTEREIVYAG
jgi:hypothetical protein